MDNIIYATHGLERLHKLHVTGKQSLLIHLRRMAGKKLLLEVVDVCSVSSSAESKTSDSYLEEEECNETLPSNSGISWLVMTAILTLAGYGFIYILRWLSY